MWSLRIRIRRTIYRHAVDGRHISHAVDGRHLVCGKAAVYKGHLQSKCNQTPPCGGVVSV